MDMGEARTVVGLPLSVGAAPPGRLLGTEGREVAPDGGLAIRFVFSAQSPLTDPCSDLEGPLCPSTKITVLPTQQSPELKQQLVEHSPLERPRDETVRLI